MHQTTPGGIYMQGKTVSLKLEFVAGNIFRKWTTLQEDFCQEETLVVERAGLGLLLCHRGRKPETHGRHCLLRRVTCIR